jgi:hypothetical protein
MGRTQVSMGIVIEALDTDVVAMAMCTETRAVGFEQGG